MVVDAWGRDGSKEARGIGDGDVRGVSFSF